MNVNRIFQFSTFILWTICGIWKTVHANTCKLNPANVDKVSITVYINGGTSLDGIWLSRYCSWASAGFPYGTYAPVTVKVGAEMTCTGANCVCPDESNAQADCKNTFQNVCVAMELGNKYLDFLCCSLLMDPQTQKPKGFDACVNEISGLKEKLAACVAKTGAGSPQEIALKNAQEVIDKKVKLDENREPFMFFDGNFDKCINDNAHDMWLQTICFMLKPDLVKTIPTCGEAMSGTP